MSSTEILSPAPWLDVMALAPPGRWIYRAMLLQRQRSDTLSIRIDGEPVAVAMFFPETDTRSELCVLLAPEAARVMRRLVRVAQLTLPRIADHGVTILVRTNPAGARMAALAGFRATGEAGGLMIWRGGDEQGGANAVRRGRRVE